MYPVGSNDSIDTNRKEAYLRVRTGSTVRALGTGDNTVYGLKRPLVEADETARCRRVSMVCAGCVRALPLINRAIEKVVDDV